jgi:hypothetical protein
LNKPDRAFSRLLAGNRAIATALDLDPAGPPPYLADVALARGFLVDDGAAPPKTPRAAEPMPPPAFLIGFPRSGTTLLEQVLDSHPRIQSMDEKPAVAAMREHFLDLVRTDGASLSTLTAEQSDALKATYLEAVDGFIDRRPGAMLIDKLPLNIVWTHLIQRVFPDARFIVAVRHPLDVCLSCFMQDFAMNRAMTGFLTLKGAALTYAAVMELWRAQRARPSLNHHAVRYEDLVDDLPRQMASTLNFLDIPWNDSVLDHMTHVKAKDIINTPSYHQVSRPLYADSKFRWRRYERYLGEIKPILAPFIEEFGYS